MSGHRPGQDQRAAAGDGRQGAPEPGGAVGTEGHGAAGLHHSVAADPADLR